MTSAKPLLKSPSTEVTINPTPDAEPQLASSVGDQPTLAAVDSITILVCAKGHSASKRFSLDKDGRTALTQYNAGTHFGVSIQSVSNIRELSTRLKVLEGSPDALAIRGAPIQPIAQKKFVRRNKKTFQTPTVGRHWLLIDFDKIPLPAELNLKRDTAGTLEHLVSLLPSEFHKSSYHYQFSSSAGMGDPRVVSAHVWFWLSEPWNDKDLKIWAKAINVKAGNKLIDPALFNDVQAHYTAAPIFDGVRNPFPDRSGLVIKDADSVSIEPPPVHERLTTSTGKGVSPSKSFEERLSAIGDHPGGEGFHEPIRDAIASHVANKDPGEIDKTALCDLIRSRALAADRSKHDLEYVEAETVPDKLLSSIDSAIEKFKKKPISRRRSKVVKGALPYFQEAHLPANDASARLRAEITEFFGIEMAPKA